MLVDARHDLEDVATAAVELGAHPPQAARAM
jgi:hypothetical protein